MGKLIDSDWLRAQWDEPTDWMDGDQILHHYTWYKTMIDVAPTVDAVPVVHSEWIPKEKADTPYGLEMECAKCGFSVIVNDALYFKFCPNCGARMDGKDGDTDGV